MTQTDTTTLTDESGTAEGPLLVISEGWVVDGLAEARLRHQLARAAQEVVGVAGTAETLSPGESFIEHSARAALRPLSDAAPHTGEIVGAVLLRPGVNHVVDDDRIEIATGRGVVLADPGAHVHDPWQPVAPIVGPPAELRPTFPRRPVVLFVGVRADADRADWARGMVNDLLRLGTDARLAVPEAADGLHLSRPCLPEPHVIDAIGPQIVVTLDEPTRRMLDRWWGANRTTMVIDYVDDMRTGVELISWRIGRAEGRVRARVGAVGRPDELAAVIDRLCGGPQPVPPADAAVPGGRGHPVALPGIRAARDAATPDSKATGPALSHELDIQIVDGGGPDAPADRYAGLLDHLRAAGHRGETRAPDTDLPAGADIVLLHRVEPDAEVHAFIEQRRRDGRPTVLALSPHDLETATDGPRDRQEHPDRYPSDEHSLRLTSTATETAVACGFALAPTRLAAVAARDAAIQTLAVPPLVTRARTTELLSQRLGLLDPTEPTVAWQVDHDADPDEVKVVAEALRRLLEAHPEVHVVVIAGDETEVALGAEATGRVLRVASRPHPWVFNQWMAQIWTASAPHLRRTGDLTPILDAGGVGLPTIVAGYHPARGLLPHPTSLTVRRHAEAEDWLGHIRPVTTDPGARLRRSQDVVRVLDGVCGPGPSSLAVERFIGWLAAERRRG